MKIKILNNQKGQCPKCKHEICYRDAACVDSCPVYDASNKMDCCICCQENDDDTCPAFEPKE